MVPNMSTWRRPDTAYRNDPVAMSTILFDRIIFGPVHSRRLGWSLGVNLLPTDHKLCNFDCIYCECGWGKRGFKPRFNPREEVRTLLRAKLQEMSSRGMPPDVITFAGNGEPTMHPQFEEIISDTFAIRDELCPTTQVSVLSNATLIDREQVRRALLRVDHNILKLDSALEATVRLINRPRGARRVAETVRLMQLFQGKLIVQTMFLRGACDGLRVDNTTEGEVSAWLDLLREIAPQQVMVYTIDRETPVEGLEKIPVDELRQIGSRVEALGIPCSVSGATDCPSIPDSRPNPGGSDAETESRAI